MKHSRILERILRGSSSEEEFEDNRKHFQARKHQSLDARVKFNLDKNKNKNKNNNSTSSSEEEFDEEGKLIHEKIHDFSKPIIIDFKDLELSDEDDEDFVSCRQDFQKQKALSVDSRKRCVV